MLRLAHLSPRVSTSRCLAMASNKAGNRAFSSRIELPEPKFVQVAEKASIEYIDVQPKSSTENRPTIVLMHGAPGTYKDFRYLIPHLQHSARVIGINLPGFGQSQALDDRNFYDLAGTVAGAQVAIDALEQICNPEEKLFILGHSVGGHSAIHGTAIARQRDVLNVSGLALLSSAGLKPHKALTPSFNSFITEVAKTRLPVVEPAARWVCKKVFVDYLGFPGRFDTSYYTAGLVRCAAMDYPQIQKDVHSLRDLPGFFAWTKDDHLIEEDISKDVADTNAFSRQIVFQEGGHNMQKTRAEVVGKLLVEWMDLVADGKGGLEMSLELP